MTVMLTAAPIFPTLTPSFPLVLVMRDEEEDGGALTAYGVRLVPEGTDDDGCDWCDASDCDALVQHGGYGSPEVGVPCHLACLVGGGAVLPTDAVTLVTPEREGCQHPVCLTYPDACPH